MAEYERTVSLKIEFGGADITSDIRAYLKDFSYTDNENAEADDLQLTLHDRDALWLTKWLNNLMESSAVVGSSGGSSGSAKTYTYKVNYSSGLWCRSGPGTGYSTVGLYSYGGSVSVYCHRGDWTAVNYDGGLGFVWTSYITASGSSAPTHAQISYGSSGDDVTTMQTMLQDLGYSVGSTGADGQFGSNTQSAVKSFQSACGITSDGICGALTWGWLYYKTNPNKATTTDSYSKGLCIKASLTRPGKGTLNCGRFDLDSIRATGPPSQIVLKGTSLFYSTGIRQNEKSRVWEGYYLSGIAKEMAANAGMGCQFLSSSNNPYYSSVEQTEQSDIEFLNDLCDESGISLKVYDNSLILFDQSEYEAKPAVRTFTRGDGSYTKWDLESSERDGKYDYCWCAYYNSSTKKIAKAYYYTAEYADNENHKGLRVKRQASSYSEAAYNAEKILKKYNKFENTAKLTIPGDPQMVSGVNIQLKNWGAFSGKYMIQTAQHTLGGSTPYTTQITCRKVVQ